MDGCLVISHHFFYVKIWEPSLIDSQPFISMDGDQVAGGNEHL